MFNDSVRDFYKSINADEDISPIIKKVTHKLIKNKKDYELFKIITELVSEDVYILNSDNSITINEYKTNLNITVKKYLQTLEVLTQISDENLDHIVKNIVKFISVLTDEVEFLAFKNYKYEDEIVNDIIINSVCDYFNCNIYFINSDTRIPYILNDFSYFTNLKSIILLNINDINYEAVGQLTHGNVIKREFLPDEQLIIKINSIINMRRGTDIKRKELDNKEETEEVDNTEEKEDKEETEEKEDTEEKEEKEDTEEKEDKEETEEADIKQETEDIINTEETTQITVDNEKDDKDLSEN